MVQNRPYVQLWDDEFVVMPNHVHGIIWISGDNVGATRRIAPTSTPDAPTPTPDAPTKPHGPIPQSIGAIIGQFKSVVTKRVNELRGTPGAVIWQRNYYERIIRDERALDAIRHYIAENPLRWHLDRHNDRATGADPLAREVWQMMHVGTSHASPLPDHQPEDLP